MRDSSSEPTPRYFGCIEAVVAICAPITEEAARRWWGDYHDSARIIQTSALIGDVRLDCVDLRDKRASLTIGIDGSTQLGSMYELFGQNWRRAGTALFCACILTFVACGMARFISRDACR
jgi:hypothetical protein